MDTGKFSGLLPRSLFLPNYRKNFNWCTYRNGARVNVGHDMFAHGAVTVIRDGGVEWANLATGAATNSQNGFATSPGSNGYVGRPDSTILFRVRLKLMQITVLRCWVGLANFFGGGFMGSDDPTDDIAAFRFSTAAGDSTWKCVRNDRSGGGTIVDSGVTVVAGTTYDMIVRFVTSTRIEYWINGVLVLAATSGNLPTAADLGNECEVRTLENVAKNIRIQHILHTTSL